REPLAAAATPKRVEAAPDPLDHAAVATAAARYLTAQDETGRPIDPVARFHLGNGARLWRVVPDADPSPRGRSRSFGLLVNYRYEPEDRAANRAELDAGRIALGDQVRELLG
ncbi:MAG TPA: malonyl-CoA decarboxylase family protein, partial [Microthrixaceae bacterium]|nr:malonyl-CoA decarboxylase family protein [Microthrixaceae bacterium]